MLSQPKKLAIYMYGLAYVLIGISHFTHPHLFVPIVPTYIGHPEFWVYLSGLFEIAMGMGLFFQKSRQVSSYIIMAMLVVLYAANLNMWVHDIEFNGTKMTTMGHVLRACFQVILLGIAYWISTLSFSNNITNKNTNLI